ncbi:MAG TPA: LarC family nickel insertion protein [Holophagaceae bacterium]
MTHLWVDPFSGFSGDIWIGGFLGLGVPEAELKAVLRQLPFPELDLRVESVMRCGLQATRASVLIRGEVDSGGTPHLELPSPGTRRLVRRRPARPQAHVHGFTWREVDALLKTHLPARIGETARGAFEKLGQAEARVHGIPLAEVHFHEVGLQDSIADVVLAAAGWVLLGEPQVWVGPVAVGKGHTRMAHGMFPIPAPAALNLLDGFELTPGVAPVDKELTTPTGAALAAQLATVRHAPARFIPARSAFATGSYDFPHTPAACRFVLGRIPEAAPDLVQLETNLDDATPQQVAHAQARALEAGALDVWVTPATFKKGRSGWVLGAVLPAPRLEPVAAVLAAEVPTLGLRCWPLQRLEAERSFSTADVEGHPVAVKEGRWPGSTVAQPEFEDARRAAEALGEPLRKVQAQAAPKAGKPRRS